MVQLQVGRLQVFNFELDRKSGHAVSVTVQRCLGSYCWRCYIACFQCYSIVAWLGLSVWLTRIKFNLDARDIEKANSISSETVDLYILQVSDQLLKQKQESVPWRRRNAENRPQRGLPLQATFTVGGVLCHVSLCQAGECICDH
jgi:hypothetical protein